MLRGPAALGNIQDDDADRLAAPLGGHARTDLDVERPVLPAGAPLSDKLGPVLKDLPVISLSTTSLEDPPEEGVLIVPWPCVMENLVEMIEAALYRRLLLNGK